MWKPNRLTIALSVVVLTVLGAGCSSRVRYIDIDSKPTGATIYVDGEKTGLTRSTKLKLDFSDDPSRRVLIQLTKPRYRPVFQYWEFDEVPAEKKVFPLEAD